MDSMSKTSTGQGMKRLYQSFHALACGRPREPPIPAFPPGGKEQEVVN
jgi:hypothetical protein